MTVSTRLKTGTIGLFVLLVCLVVAGWLLPRLYEQKAASIFQQQFARYSDQKLQHFTTQISVFEHFPTITFTFQDLCVVDTSSGTPVKVLAVAHAKVTVNIQDLIQESVPVQHVYLNGVRFNQQVDSLGVKTSFRFRRKDTTITHSSTDPLVHFPQISITDAHITTQNDYKHTGFSIYVTQADLFGSFANDTLLLTGALRGRTGYLKSKNKLRFQHQPFTASARYSYRIAQKTGIVEWSRIILQNDTLSLTGTHTRLPTGIGAQLNLELKGSIHLNDLLKESLPPKLKTYVANATSPSKVQIRYTMTGESSPKKRPHAHLWFSLKEGELIWANTLTRLKHLSLTGELDNGKQQIPSSSMLRIYSFHCQSDIDSFQGKIEVSNFEQPFVRIALAGRLNVRTLTTIINLPKSSEYAGILQGEVTMQGFVKAPEKAYFSDQLRWNGTFTLQKGVVAHPALTVKGTDIQATAHFANHALELSQVQGKINGYSFYGQTTIHDLLGYVFKYNSAIKIDANLNTQRFDWDWITQKSPKPSAPTPASAQDSVRIKPTTILPDFIQLNLQLACTQFIFVRDTIHNIQAYVRNSGSMLHVLPLSFQFQGGTISGSVHTPNNWKHPGQSQIQLTWQLPTLNLRQTVQAVSQARQTQKPAAHPMSAMWQQQIHALIQEAEAHVTVRIGNIQLPGDENLQRFSMQIDKKGTQVSVPSIRFVTTARGTATGTGSFRLRSTAYSSPQVIDPLLNLRLNYPFLNLQQFMQQIAAMGNLLPSHDADLASELSTKIIPIKPYKASKMHLLAAAGNYRVNLEVNADKIHYQTFNGRGLALQTHIHLNKATVEKCSMQAFGGGLAMEGTLAWNHQQEDIPVELRLRLQHMNLHELFKVSDELNLDILRSQNIAGIMSCNLSVHTQLNQAFTPQLSKTLLYCKALIQDMELIDVQPIQHALRFIRKKRTEHLYFKDVNAHFMFHENRFLTPGVRLDNNICQFTLSGSYTMNGPADLYMDLNVFEILFGNNKRRIEQIQQQTDTVVATHQQHVLVYRLANDYKQNAYKVKLFNKKERSSIERVLLQEFRQQLRQQKIDTLFTQMQQVVDNQ